MSDAYLNGVATGVALGCTVTSLIFYVALALS